MATFGSYGNLGGELVSVVEVNQAIGGTTTTVYTVPTSRYALVVIRYIVTGLVGTFVRFNYSGFYFEYGNRSFYPAQFTNNTESMASAVGLAENVQDNFEPKLMNEGETITVNSSNINFLIFEYRKP